MNYRESIAQASFNKQVITGYSSILNCITRRVDYHALSKYPGNLEMQSHVFLLSIALLKIAIPETALRIETGESSLKKQRQLRFMLVIKYFFADKVNAQQLMLSSPCLNQVMPCDGVLCGGVATPAEGK